MLSMQENLNECEDDDDGEGGDDSGDGDSTGGEDNDDDITYSVSHLNSLHTLLLTTLQDKEVRKQ